MSGWTLRTTATWAAIGTAMPIVVGIFHVHSGALRTFLWPTYFMVSGTVNASSFVRVIALAVAFLSNAVVYGLLGFGVAMLDNKATEGRDGH